MVEHRRVSRLSDAGFRLFVTSLAYSVANRTDGRLDKDDLVLMPAVDPAYVDELVDQGLLTEMTSGSWLSTVYADSQSSKAQLDGLSHKREQDKHRQANKRARDQGFPEPYPTVSRDSPRDITSDDARDTKDRPGQDRQGIYGTGSQAVAACTHGIANGDQPDPWVKGRIACPQCAAQSQPETRTA